MVRKIVNTLKACNPLNHMHIMLQCEDVIGPGERSVIIPSVSIMYVRTSISSSKIATMHKSFKMITIMTILRKINIKVSTNDKIITNMCGNEIIQLKIVLNRDS